MLKPKSPAFPLCHEIALILKEEGKKAAETRWAAYVDSRKKARQPVKLWEQAAIQDTVRGITSPRRYLRGIVLHIGRDRSYVLRTWLVGNDERRPGGSVLGYELIDPNGKVLFTGEDFCPPPGEKIESDKVIRELLGFLTLRPGDTDKEYFDKYTQDQHDFAATDAEEMSIFADDEFTEPFENEHPLEKKK